MGIGWGRRDGRRDEGGHEISLKYLEESLGNTHFLSSDVRIPLCWSLSLFPSLSFLTSSILFLASPVSLLSDSWSEFINFYCWGSFLHRLRFGIRFYGYQAAIRGETRWKDDCSSLAKCGYLSWITHKFVIKRPIRSTSGVTLIALGFLWRATIHSGLVYLFKSVCQDWSEALKLQALVLFFWFTVSHF